MRPATGFIAEDERDARDVNDSFGDQNQDQLRDVLDQNFEDHSQTCDDASIQKDIITFGPTITQLGGEIQNPLDYDEDFVGLQKFLTLSGVENFSALEVGTPGSKEFADKCQLKHLIPKRNCWIRIAALLKTGDTIRNHLGMKARITSLYRPQCYNKLLKGAKTSDHLSARSMDMSFYEASKRKKAADFICQNFWKDDFYNLSPHMNVDDGTLNISIGLGGTYMHIGLASPKGRRYWIYKSYLDDEDQSNSCWGRN